MSEKEEKLAMDFWGRIENRQIETKINLKTICSKYCIQYQTMLNQKSSAHLPSLYVAVILATELGTSVEWLLFGDTEKHKVEDSVILAQQVFKDRRLFSIMQRLCNASQEELFALEVLFKIRN